MSGSNALERRYRRLLALYPKGFRRAREDEMLSVLMDASREGQRWPRPREVWNLLAYAAFGHIDQGPPPGSFARRHARSVVVIRALVALWLVVVTVFLCQYSLWALLLLGVVAVHVYLAVRAAAYAGGSPGDGDLPRPPA